MTRRKKNELRTLTEEERDWLERISRSQSEPAIHVAHAKEILAVAIGSDYTQAARSAGQKSGDTVAHLVERFNSLGLQALQPKHGGGPTVKYSAAERERVLAEARRKPDPEKEGTNTWSLTILQKALRSAPDAPPKRTDRDGLSDRRETGIGGVGGRRSRTVSDRAISRRKLATRRASGASTT